MTELPGNTVMTVPDDLRCTLAGRSQGVYALWEVISSSSLHNALFALFLAGILAYGAGFAWYMLARFDLLNLIRDVSIDDAFYYFQIAHNLADGQFSTFDGGITRTNGYHPLWLWLITPFYWIFDKETALFGIKAFEIMLIAGAVVLIAVAAWLARLPWILLFAALPMLYQGHSLLIWDGSGGGPVHARAVLPGPDALRPEPGTVEVGAGRCCLCPAVGAAGIRCHIADGHRCAGCNRVFVAGAAS